MLWPTCRREKPYVKLVFGKESFKTKTAPMEDEVAWEDGFQFAFKDMCVAYSVIACVHARARAN